MFERFRAEGRRVTAGDLWCVVITDAELGEPRVAYAIGRSIGPAVVRNRIRRRLRSLLADHGDHLAPGWYLIGVRPSATKRSYQELSTMLQQMINRIGTVAR